jgi:hypothetical protein
MHSLRRLLPSAVLALAFASFATAAKPVLLIETDLGGDKDDQASLCRLLLHSNELDIQALICDRPANQFDDPNEWSPSSSITTGVQMANYYLDAYDEVDENLRLHDSTYPTAATLKARVFSGAPGNNAGRDRIISVVDNTPAGSHVYYSNWGSNVRESTSSSTTIESSLERAFDKVLTDRGDSGLRAFVRKIRQVSLDGNSNRHGTLNIRSDYKDIIRDESFHIETGWPVVGGTRWYHRFQPITATAGGFQQNNDISNTHGALAPLYRGAGQKEGDSWSTLYVLPLGLSDLAQPTWGGPAGRYLPRSSGPTDAQGLPFYWNEASDSWNGSSSRDNTAARFAAAVQNTFRARWDWCYMTFAQANHDPVPTMTVNGGNSVTMGVRRLSLAAGSTVNLAATVSDPDSGDTHSYSWTYYKEAGTYTGDISISNASSANASLTLPSNSSGKQIHVYLAVTDNGSRKGNRVPDLTRFCRVVIDVTGGTTNNTAPAFTTQPASVTKAAGTDHTFSVVVTGTPTPTLQWRKDGVNIAGATGTSYTLTNIQSAAAGTYTVVATNSVTSTPSSNAVLTVTGGPGGDGPIVYQAENLTHTQSDTVTTFSETAASGGKNDVLAANAVGDYVEYSVNVASPKSYAISVTYKAMASRGIARLSIGGTPQGDTFDQRATGYRTVSLGSRELSAGTHLFRFQVTGTSGTGYSLSVDAITLTP